MPRDASLLRASTLVAFIYIYIEISDTRKCTGQLCRFVFLVKFRTEMILFISEILIPALVPSIVQSEKYTLYSVQIERHMIVVTIFLLIMNRSEVSLVHNRKENCR